MKTPFITSLFLAFILMVSACREISVTTKINKDGSFTRVITITGDSTDLFDKNLPYPVDDSWLMELKHDTVDSSLYVTYTKTYRNDELLNKELNSDTGWMKKLKRKIDIHKRFGFFYSYIYFNEKIEMANPFTEIPLSDQLSAEEIKWLKNEVQPVTPADSTKKKDIEDKALEVVANSMAREISGILEDGIRQLNDPELSPQIVIAYQDSINTMINDWNFDSAKEFIPSLARWSGKEKILDIEKNSPGIFNDFDSKAAYFIHVVEMHDYTQTVEMPGLIIGTNSLSIKGNQVKWKVESMAFLLTDYSMFVESRVVNYWMFVLTGIIVLFLLALLVIRSFR